MNLLKIGKDYYNTDTLVKIEIKDDAAVLHFIGGINVVVSLEHLDDVINHTGANKQSFGKMQP